MDADSFRSSPVGDVVPIKVHDARLDRTIEHFAFDPHPLPEEPELSARTYKLISEAERELGRLDAQVAGLPNPNLLVTPALSREAVATSALEGTYAPISEVLAADNIDDSKKSAELREVQNYTRAAIMGLQLIQSKPICFSVAAQLQSELVTGTRGDGFDSGRMRQRIVAIGDRAGDITTARFVPVPPGDQLTRGLDEWEKWTNRDDDVPFIARLALSHYQFETLHPFSDGNGRIGRLLVALHLVDAGVLRYPVLNLSSWLEPRRQDYIDHLLTVSQDGDYDRWVAFFAQGVRAQAVASAQRVSRLTQLQDQIVGTVLAAGRKGIIVELARDLVGRPILSVSNIKNAYDISQPSARQVVLKLVELGILRPVGNHSGSRLYICDSVYDAITQD